MRQLGWHHLSFILKVGGQTLAKIEAIKLTAYELGNTPKVCRDSYIDPMLYNLE